MKYIKKTIEYDVKSTSIIEINEKYFNCHSMQGRE